MNAQALYRLSDEYQLLFGENKNIFAVYDFNNGTNLYRVAPIGENGKLIYSESLSCYRDDLVLLA